jgi:hypothetical protein
VVLEMRHSNAPTLGGAIAVVAILALPTVFTGAAGAVINIVRDAPDPMASNSQQSFMPPEMAGFSTVLRTLVPLIVSIIGALSILIVRSALRVQGPSAVVPAAIRSAVACTLVVAGVAAWVRHRDAMRAKFRAFMNEGRAVTQQQRSSR